MKHCLECLICLLNRDKNYGLNGEEKSSKSMLIKTGYPNLLHGFDFACLNLMNYS